MIGLMAVFLEATLLNSLRIFNVKPALSLLLVVLGALNLEEDWALGLAVFVGLLKDIFALKAFGINTFFFVLFALAAFRLSRKISLDNINLRLGLFCIILILYDILLLLVSYYFFNFSIPLGVALRTVFLEALYTAAVFPLAVKFIR